MFCDFDARNKICGKVSLFEFCDLRIPAAAAKSRDIAGERWCFAIASGGNKKAALWGGHSGRLTFIDPIGAKK